jgi:hypothetical protein
MGHPRESVTNQKTGIAPMPSVRQGAKAIEFYKAAFGAGELFRIDSESGEVVGTICGRSRILGCGRISRASEL